MQETIEAIYENGVLRPLKPLGWLRENRRVTVTITTEDKPHPLADLFGIMPKEDADEMLHIVESEFGTVDPDARQIR